MTDSPRRQNGPVLLCFDLKALTRQALGKRGFAATDLIERWSDVVGTELSQGVRPNKITYPKGARANGTLHVKVMGGAFATLLEHRKKYILEKINTFLGYVAVTDIKMTQGAFLASKVSPKAPSPRELTPEEEEILQNRVKEIEDKELKKAVYDLGKTIFLK